ncbi:TetR family transcriptional regulator C-terminal domain-containing protein [Mammaliicoccus lentus]|uniref:TetR family transcriptional regulator C-terminal domain-containing protein n=1 Tax=Mammaliicoccus lentus TaxID=42858 RepID=UPI002A5A9947|nr:TetR family transcriptional regulator C-terminal domain-containing protein [Mammaliicoccus lentus]WQL55485.1 TetR family transcriptional regulator C-terminal domain-containing protein [Mammaliicoccus lentus]
MEKQNLFVNKIDFEEFINFALQLLPLDKEREIEFVAWTALVNKSLSNEDMRKVAHDNLLKNYEGIKQVFKLMVDSGIFKATLDINKSTNEFYSFLEGLSQHSLLLRDYYNDKLLKNLVERFVKSNYLDKDLNN